MTIFTGTGQTWGNAAHTIVNWTNPGGSQSSVSIADPDVAAWLAVPNTPAAFPTPSLEQQWITQQAIGFVVTFSTTTALSGTYALDDVSLAYLQGLYNRAAGVSANFPGGTTTFEYPDRAYSLSNGASGALHNFTVPTFVAFGNAVSDYLFAGSSAVKTNTSLPSNTVTIAL